MALGHIIVRMAQSVPDRLDRKAMIVKQREDAPATLGEKAQRVSQLFAIVVGYLFFCLILPKVNVTIVELIRLHMLSFLAHLLQGLVLTDREYQGFNACPLTGILSGTIQVVKSQNGIMICFLCDFFRIALLAAEGQERIPQILIQFCDSGIRIRLE